MSNRIAMSIAPALLIVGLLTAAAAAAETFSVIALPDTQNYSENYATTDYPGGLLPIFQAQTQWIADHQASNNIRFVTHLGDIVQHGASVQEWENSRTAMDTLDAAGIPYGTCAGNHDTHYGYNAAEYPNNRDLDAVNYRNYYGSQRYETETWWGGASPSGRSNYQVIQAGGMDFLFLQFMVETPTPELEWAQDVLAANRDKPVIVSTHKYLMDYRIMQGRYPKDFVAGGWDNKYSDETGVSAEDLWETFISKNRNIFMVLSGHCHGEYRQVSMNDFGLPVHEILCDLQDSPNGGNGWMKELVFDVQAGTIEARTFSPTLGRDRTTQDSFVETIAMVGQYESTLRALYGDAGFETMLAQMQQPVVNGQPTWGGLWMAVFANGTRDPSFTMDVDFASYVPEPASLSVLALGGLVLLGRKRRA